MSTRIIPVIWYMIDRYSTPKMREIWSLDYKFEIWKKIEIAACEYWYNEGRIPPEDWQNIKEHAEFSTMRVLEIEKEIHHDVIAFLTNMAEEIGPSSRYVHFGMTSSDVVDTGLSMIVVEAAGLILKAYRDFLKALKEKAEQYRNLPAVGRTHGVHAEPTTLGLKLLGYYEESRRNYDRLQEAASEMAYGKISGAVGTYSQLPPELEEFVLNKLGLKVETVSTQVVPRDRHAFFINAVTLAGQGLARLAQEVRLMQKTESREIEEPFQRGQKGSSAMPHKRNPILCERISGLARVLNGYSQTAMQNIGLWHERDISHSGAERIIMPDATSLLEYMLHKMTYVVENLHVFEDNLTDVLEKTRGLIYSSRALLAVTEELQTTREEAYKIVQEEAMTVWNNSTSDDLESRLRKRPELKDIPEDKWKHIFDPQSFLVHIDKVFERSTALPDD